MDGTNSSQKAPTLPAPPILVIPFQRTQNAKQVDARSQNDKHVEYLVGVAPDIKASWIQLFREPRTVDEGADEDYSALRVVVGEAGLLVELRERE